VIEKQITIDEVKILLERLIQSAVKSECWSCECFQGFISKLEVDSSRDIYNFVELFKSVDESKHNCLGCSPCPPADLYKEYLEKQS